MTLPLELGGIQDPDVRRALENVAQQFPIHAPNLANEVLLLASTGTARKVAFGTTAFTFTAANTSAGVNQNHGLGKTPIAVVMTGWWVATGTRLGTAHVIEPTSWDATQFPCIATVQGAVYTGNATASWVAIG